MGRYATRPASHRARVVIATCLNPLEAPPAADRILVVRLSAMGDVVRTLPAVSALRAAYAGAHLAWLVEPGAASALLGQPWVDEVIVFPRGELVEKLRRGELRRAAAQFGEFARQLRARRFELVIDFHALLRSALLARLSGAPRRVSYARPFGRELSWLLATDRARLAPARISRFERNEALVRFLGVDAEPLAAPLHVEPVALARVAATLGPRRSPVALHPGTSETTRHKRWPAECYAELARRLAQDGLECVVTWGPAGDERKTAEAVVAASDGAARLAPRTPDIGELAALLSSCCLTVSGDTGPLHVASLVGTPVVQILGPTDATENAPWPRTPSRTVRAAAGGMDVPPPAVAVAALELLAAQAAAAPRAAEAVQ